MVNRYVKKSEHDVFVGVLGTGVPRLACLPTWYHARRWPGRVPTREGAVTDEIGLSPVPDKARTPGKNALNAPCPVMRGITSHHCTLSTSCVPLWQPLSYKRRPEATRRGIQLFWSSTRTIASSRTLIYSPPKKE